MRHWLVLLGLVILVAIVAFAPLAPASGWATLLMSGAVGAAVAGRERRAGDHRFLVGPWVVLIALGALGLAIFWGAPNAVRWRTGDWGPHHLLTSQLARSFTEGRGVPHWVQSVSTGDSPYETYPVLAYIVATGLTLLLGARDNVPAVLFALAIACHIGISLSIARLALRWSHWSVAAIAGALAMVDVGGFETGAVESILGVGLLHAALAQCLTLTAFIASLDFLARPTRLLAAIIWATVALASACHPSTLMFLCAFAIALALATALSPEVRPRRAALLVLTITLGALSSSWVWSPFLARVLRYGLPFAFRLPTLDSTLEDVVISLRMPPSSFAMWLGIGILGLACGLFGRRAAPTVTAITSAVLLLAYTDAPHLILGSAASPSFARLQPFRFVALARPLLFALAAYAVCLTAAGLRREMRPLDRARRRWVGAVAGLLVLVVLRATIPFALRKVEDVRGRTAREVPAADGFRTLVDWARAESARGGAGAVGRLFYEGDSDSNSIHHLAAETGVPVVFLDDTSPCAVGRERMEDDSPASLRRFNVRWIAAKGHSPRLGSEASERRFGRYFVREWEDWDGRFARVEQGAGQVMPVAIEDERVELELRGTNAPALVALGTGYYPRWRARLADGRDAPVQPVPSVPGGASRVPAAWVPPGRVTFTPDGPLPSDTSGRGAAALALGVAIALVISDAVPSSRRRLRRAAVQSDRALRRSAASWWPVAVPLIAVLGTAWAVRDARAPVRAVQLGSGWSGAAAVEARAKGSVEWRQCKYARSTGLFHCQELGRVGAGTASEIGHRGSLNAYLTPAIRAWPADSPAEFRIRLARRLAGAYVAATVGKGATAELRTAGAAPVTLTRQRSRLLFEPGAGPTPIEVTLSTPGGGDFGVVIVGEEWLVGTSP